MPTTLQLVRAFPGTPCRRDRPSLRRCRAFQPLPFLWMIVVSSAKVLRHLVFSSYSRLTGGKT